jgi:hypothetical protein
MQVKIKEGFMTVGKVGTKENVSDLGTKRLTRDRMEYLMNLCKVYNMANSQFVGSSFAEKLEEQQILRVGIKNVRQMGFNGTTSKSLMRVLLINALSSTMAMGMPADPLTSSFEHFRALWHGDGVPPDHHLLAWWLFGGDSSFWCCTSRTSSNLAHGCCPEKSSLDAEGIPKGAWLG